MATTPLSLFAAKGAPTANTKQMRSWLFADTLLRFAPGFPAVVGQNTANQSNDLGNQASAAAFDANNQLLFYVNYPAPGSSFRQVFSATNQFIGELKGIVNPGGADWFVPGKEMVVVPVPGACQQYYLFYTLAGVTTTIVAYATINCLGASPKIETNSQRVGTYLYYSAPGLAVSQVENGKRQLYVAGGTTVVSYNLSASVSNGIDSELLRTPAGSFVGGSCEAELSPDGNLLAWAPASGQQVHILNVRNNIPITPFTPNLTFGTALSGTISGLEFSAGSDKLYIIGGRGGAEYTLGSQLQKAIPVSEDTLAGNSQIELGFDGLLYTTYRTVRVDSVTKQQIITHRPATINPTSLLVKASPLVFRMRETGGVGINSAIFTFPDQIDGEDYTHHFGNSPPSVSDLRVDNYPLGYSNFRNVYSCNPLTLTATLSPNIVSMTVTVTAVNGSGNPTGTYSYTHTTTTLPLDLKALNGNYLATHPGLYTVTVCATTACSGQVKTVTGRMNVSYLTPASAGFAFAVCTGNLTQAAATSAGNPASLGVVSNGSINIQFSTGTFDDYQVRFEKLVNGQFQPVGFQVDQPNPLATGNPPTLYLTYLAGQAGLGTAYFQSGNPGFNTVHRLVLTVSNGCGISPPLTGYFITNDYACRPAPAPGTGTVAQQAPLYPNPLTGAETGHLRFTLPTAQPVSLTLVDALTGQVRLTVLREAPRAAGEQEATFDAGTLPAGVYLYRLTTAEGTTTGRLLKAD